jgi:hypothetical protein
MKVVINVCYGGFGLSDAAYEWLIAQGIPVRKHMEQERDEKGLYLPQPLNDGRVIFDRKLSRRTLKNVSLKEEIRFMGRYWDMWTDEQRGDSLVVGVVEALGEKANGKCAKLKVVEIPDGIQWMISEYDGMEQVKEKHRSWS